MGVAKNEGGTVFASLPTSRARSIVRRPPWLKKFCPLSKVYGLLEAVKAWLDPALKTPRTLHHRGKGAFMIAGETVKLPSKMN